MLNSNSNNKYDIELVKVPETKLSSTSGGTIGPLYSNNPSDFLLMNSRLK